jgi:hypothetical protein
MRVPLLLVLTLAAPAAQAERLAFQCTFDGRCDDLGCEPSAASYQYRLDTDAGTGEMIAEGYTYPGAHLASGDTHHFVFVNSAGVEVTSITAGGRVLYSGHMTIEGQPTWYRLEGQCTERTK